ncbi:MAG: VOC family protein [Bacteroidota bacterium]
MTRTVKIVVLITLLLNIHLVALSQKQHPVLNHIALYVKDLKVSTGFYSNIVQLDTIPEPFHDGRHTWFSIGNKSHLHLIQGAAAITAHDKNSHVCFSVASVNDFITILKQNKVEYENWAGEKNAVTKRVDAVQQIYFKDPDGYWIEINDVTK